MNAPQTEAIQREHYFVEICIGIPFSYLSVDTSKGSMRCRALFNLILGCACLFGFIFFRWLGVQFYICRLVSLFLPSS